LATRRIAATTLITATAINAPRANVTTPQHLANACHDITRFSRIASTVIYTEIAPQRFKGFWKD